MKLYDFGPAVNAQRVRVFLAEKGLEVPTEQLNVREDHQFAEPFTSMNPFHCVPFLELDDGTVIARRFSEGGYRVAMLARNAENLAALADKYEDARAYPCDVGDLDALVDTVSRVRADMGAPRVVVHNALRSTRGSILKMDPDDLEKNFRVNATALLHLARETLPAMLDAGDGAILVTGNTSATRGRANWGFFASTKAAQRILAESIAREFGPQGIHVAYFIIDAAIDTPRTRPILAPDEPDEFFAKPSAIADEMYRVAHQDRSTWSFRVELRPFCETW